MSVKVHVHKTHRHLTNGEEVIEVEGTKVGECLKNLAKRHPSMEKEIFTAKGKLNPLFEIYVNAESAYPEELAKTVKNGDDIHITLLLSGG